MVLLVVTRRFLVTWWLFFVGITRQLQAMVLWFVNRVDIQYSNKVFITIQWHILRLMYFVLLFASRYKNQKQRGEACSEARTGGFLGLGKEGSMFKFTVMSSFLFRVLSNDPYISLYIAWMRLFNLLKDVAEYYLLIMNFQNLMALFLYSVYFHRHIFNNSVKFSLNIKIRMRLETTM